ncbi:MAG: hypothetical protein LBS26_07140 [Campylobacteraceae bacterium]|nr:hypothetical protein [Campylobacteraceae bacterium]
MKIKCFGKKALIKSQQVLDNLGDNLEPQPLPKTKNGERIRDFFNKVINKPLNEVEPVIEIGKIDDSFADIVAKNFGFNIRGFTRIITRDGFIHIRDEHMKNPNDHRPITENDMLKYEDIVTNPDKIAQTKTKQGLNAIAYLKRYDETVYIVEEVRSRAKNSKIPSLAPKTMFKAKVTSEDWKAYKGNALNWIDVKTQALDATSKNLPLQLLNVRNAPVNDIIPQSLWQNQVDSFFNKFGKILHKADKAVMNAAQKPTKGALRKAFGDSFVTLPKTFEEIGEMVENFRNTTRQIYSQAANRREALEKLLTPEDKVTLHKALGGDMDPNDLPKHLEALYNNIRKMIDDNAEALIKAGALKEKYKIDDYLKRYYKQHYEEKQGIIASYFSKKYKARKDLTYDKRIALEMIEDSSIVVPNTIAEQRVQLVKANFLKQVADRYGKDAEFEGSVRMSDETIGGGIMKYGALGGKYVPREISDAIRGAKILKENLSFLENVLYPIMDHIKVNVTVKNPTTHLYNFGSNLFLSFLHGDMRAVARTIKLCATDKAAFDTLVQRAHAQGIVSKLGDFEDNFKNIKLEKGDGLASVILKNVYMAEGSKAGDFMRKAYGWEDLLFKIAHFDKLTRQGVSDEVAARAAKEAYVNYATPLPAFVRMLDKTGLMPFLGYTYRSTPMVIKTIAKHPFRFAVLQAALVGAGGSAWFGDNDKKNAYKPKWAANKWYVNAFGADSWIKVSNGWYFNAGRLVPAFRFDGFDGFELQGGFLNGLINIAGGKSPLGYKIEKEDDDISTRIFKRTTEMAKNYLPPLTLGRYAQQSVGYVTGINPPMNYYDEEMGVGEIAARAFGVRNFNAQKEAAAKVSAILNKQKKEIKEAETWQEKDKIRNKYRLDLEKYKGYERSSKFNLNNF